MPRLTQATGAPHRTLAELAAHRATLKPRKNKCGHTEINAGDYYQRTDKRCLECYRKMERDRARGGVVPAPKPLKSAGHTGRRDKLPSDPEVQAALGVLRDAKGARRGRQGYVYLITETLETANINDPTGNRSNPLLVKIGYSTNPRARLREIQTSNGRILKLLAYFPGTEADEDALHRKYKHLNTVQEWFRPTVALLSEFGLYADGSRRAAA